MTKPIFLKYVMLRNYKSIKECLVHLGPLTFLIGPNGAGKSNFLDALRFVTESLNTSLEHALRERGGINEVRRRSSGRPTNVSILLAFQLPNETSGIYAFEVTSKPRSGFEVRWERCGISGPDASRNASYRVQQGKLCECSLPVVPPPSPDRLYLVAASGLPPFRPLYNALSHMGFYNLNPDTIKELQPPDAGEILKRDGSNLASVLSVMSKENPQMLNRIVEFLSKIAPGIEDIEIKHVGKKETLEFRQFVGSNKDPWRFLAENMSDGTLRALGVLTALFQFSGNGANNVPFVGIEEPEVAVHPGAAGVLRDSLFAASAKTQIAVTSHSPDLLDDKDIPDNNILSVVNRAGETTIGPLDEASRLAIRERLYTAGELLRLNQMEPDLSAAESASANHYDLFEDNLP